MKDRHVLALERVLSRRRQFERKLNALLASQRAESGALSEALDERRSAADTQAGELARQDDKIEAMLGGAAFRADELLMLREFRSVSAERHAMLEAEAGQAAAVLAAKAAEIDDTRTKIVRNRSRVDIYDKRRHALVKAIETAIEDAQDEEASESRRPRGRAF
jgi:Bacterial type III secretion protein (HrpB7)